MLTKITPRQTDQDRERNKMHTKRKGRSKSVSVFTNIKSPLEKDRKKIKKFKKTEKVITNKHILKTFNIENQHTKPVIFPHINYKIFENKIRK
jgi:hypothetical protein